MSALYSNASSCGVHQELEGVILLTYQLEGVARFYINHNHYVDEGWGRILLR